MKSWFVPLLVGAALAAATARPIAAQSPGSVHVRCRISVPSGVTEPLTMAAQVYRVKRDDGGTYQVSGGAQNLIVSLTPGDGGTAAGKFDVDLEPGGDVLYEFKVVPLDAEGYERTDGRYNFANPAGAADGYDNAIPLLPGRINEVVLNLKWIPGDGPPRSNFITVTPRAERNDYLLKLSVAGATGISLLN